jgi:hypothetical protein
MTGAHHCYFEMFVKRLHVRWFEPTITEGTACVIVTIAEVRGQIAEVKTKRSAFRLS